MASARRASTSSPLSGLASSKSLIIAAACAVDEDKTRKFLLSFTMFITSHELWTFVQTSEFKAAVSPRLIARFLYLWVESRPCHFVCKEMRHQIVLICLSLPHSDELNKLKMLLIRLFTKRPKYRRLNIPQWSPDATAAADKEVLVRKMRDFVRKSNTALPEELAEQLTVLEFNAFRHVAPDEVLNKSFSSSEKEKQAPNLTKLISNFNWVSYWVSSKILCSFTTASKGEKVDASVEDSMREISLQLAQAIKIAIHAYRLKNLNLVAEVTAGITHCAVERLPRRIWETLDESMRDALEYLSALVSPIGNYGKYRALLNRMKPQSPLASTSATNTASVSTTENIKESFLPLIPVLLKDVTFICDGNPDRLPDGSCNWVKAQMMSAQLLTIHEYQRRPYRLPDRSGKVLKDFYSCAPLIDEELWASLAIIQDVCKVNKVPNPIAAHHSRDLISVNVDELLTRSMETWSRTEVIAWLRGVNMQRIVPVLSDANLDGAALRHITEESLLNYGVTQLGVRKRLLRYIEAAAEGRLSITDSLTNDHAVLILSTPEPTSPLSEDPRVWSGDDVVRWLRDKLHETEFLLCFTRIDGKRLLECSDQDLIEIGVSKLGTRKRIMREIQSAFKQYQRSLLYPIRANGNEATEGGSTVRSNSSDSDFDTHSASSSPETPHAALPESFSTSASSQMALQRSVSLQTSTSNSSIHKSELGNVATVILPSPAATGSPIRVASANQSMPNISAHVVSASPAATSGSRISFHAGLSSAAQTAPLNSPSPLSVSSPSVTPHKPALARRSSGSEISLSQVSKAPKLMRDWEAADVMAWLDSLDLSEYRSCFSCIRGTTLSMMKEADLVALGVTKLGHKKKILKAIEIAH